MRISLCILEKCHGSQRGRKRWRKCERSSGGAKLEVEEKVMCLNISRRNRDRDLNINYIFVTWFMRTSICIVLNKI